MWLVIKVEIHKEEIGFVDSMWAYLNDPWSYTLLLFTFDIYFWVSLQSVLFPASDASYCENVA